MKKQSLNDTVYDIISGYSASTAAAIIKDLIVGEFESLQEHLRETEFSSCVYTDEIDEEINNFIKDRL